MIIILVRHARYLDDYFRLIAKEHAVVSKKIKSARFLVPMKKRD